MTGAEPPSDPVPAWTDGGGLKLGKPVGGVFGPCSSVGCGPECGAGWALNPLLCVGTAACVGLWLDG